MRTFLLFCLLAAPLLILAQSNSSFALTLLHYDLASKTGKQPVSGSKLRLTHQSTKAVYSAITDANGRATLQLPTQANYLLSLDCPHCDDMQPIEINAMDTEEGLRMTFTFQEYSAAYYRLKHEDAIAFSAKQIAAEKAEEENRKLQQAEYEKQAAEDRRQEKLYEEKKAAQAAQMAERDSKGINAIFYVILPNEENIYGMQACEERIFCAAAVYEDESRKNLYGTIDSYYQGNACMGSLENNKNSGARMHHPKTGTYKYYAISGDGKYEWRGSYTIAAGKVTAVPLHLSAAKPRKK